MKHSSNPLSGPSTAILSAPALKELQAVCAVMRKLLLAIHAMLRTNFPFDSRRFFSPNETTT